MRRCPNCSKRVSDEIMVCPNCGRTVPLGAIRPAPAATPGAAPTPKARPLADLAREARKLRKEPAAAPAAPPGRPSLADFIGRNYIYLIVAAVVVIVIVVIAVATRSFGGTLYAIFIAAFGVFRWGRQAAKKKSRSPADDQKNKPGGWTF
jgi:hypothetical protein